VLATETYPEVDENFDEPIAVLGDVPEEMLGLLEPFPINPYHSQRP
jgi:hypothetical protein